MSNFDPESEYYRKIESINECIGIMKQIENELTQSLRNTYYALFGHHIERISPEVYEHMGTTKQCLHRLVRLNDRMVELNIETDAYRERMIAERQRRDTVRRSNELDDV